MANDLVPFAPSPKLGDLENFADCFKAAKSLQKGDDAGVNTILKRAAELGLSGIQVEMLIVEIHARTGNSKKMLKKAFESFVKIVAEEKAEAKKNAAADAADQWQKMRDEERERLWKSCRHIAEHPDLLEAMEEIAHQLLGVVNEGAAVQAGYLTCMSRHLVGEAIRYLRTGASASGKNYPVEKVFQFIFRDDVIHISGASAKAIAYFGGQDAPDALKHKILYIPEADILARKQGDSSNEVATMLRTLISEGVLVHQTVVTDPMTGRRETETIVKNGPIAVILTTADDVDDQLKTRALIMGTDESGEQTEAIVERILSNVGRKPINLQPWNDFDLWLRIDAPYRVEVPFAAAVSKAFKMSRPGFLQAASMRMRRDADSFLTAVKASAATHKAQRKTTEDGAIIATLDDYQHALKAFDGGLATAHGHTSEAVISVVAAVEEMLKEEGVSDLDPKPDSPSVKVAVRDLCKRLRIASTSTAKERLDEAVTIGALEYDDTKHGGRGRPRYFRVLKTAAELRAEPPGGVFPSLDEVRNFFSTAPDETAEQNEQFADGEAKARI